MYHHSLCLLPVTPSFRSSTAPRHNASTTTTPDRGPRRCLYRPQPGYHGLRRPHAEPLPKPTLHEHILHARLVVTFRYQRAVRPDRHVCCCSVAQLGACCCTLCFFCELPHPITAPAKRHADDICRQLPANLIVLASSLLSTIVSLIAIIFSSVVNNRSGFSSKDTLQSWTCRWRSLHNAGLEAVPQDYDTLCHETVSHHVC